MPAASFQPQTIDLSASFVQLIRTALANPKVTFDKTGLKSYDAAGTLVSAINSDGTAQLKGVLSALGLIAPASISNATPQPSNSFQWQRQSDGSQVAQLWAGSAGGTEAMLGETNSLAQTDSSTIILRVKDDQATVHSSIQISQHNRGSGQILVGPVPAAGGGTTNLVLCTESGLSDFCRLGASGAVAINGGNNTLAFLNSTNSNGVTFNHGLPRQPFAVICTAFQAPAFGQIPLFNCYAVTPTQISVNAETKNAVNGNIGFTWIALA